MDIENPTLNAVIGGFNDPHICNSIKHTTELAKGKIVAAILIPLLHPAHTQTSIIRQQIIWI